MNNQELNEVYVKLFNIKKLELLISNNTEMTPDLRELENTSVHFILSLYRIFEEFFETEFSGDYSQGYDAGVEEAMLANDIAKDEGRAELKEEMEPKWNDIEDALLKVQTYIEYIKKGYTE